MVKDKGRLHLHLTHSPSRKQASDRGGEKQNKKGSSSFLALTLMMRLMSVVSACTRWKLAIRVMGRKPSESILRRRKKSRSRLSTLK